MKKTLLGIMLTVTFCLFLFSCEKKEDTVIVETMDALSVVSGDEAPDKTLNRLEAIRAFSRAIGGDNDMAHRGKYQIMFYVPPFERGMHPHDYYFLYLLYEGGFLDNTKAFYPDELCKTETLILWCIRALETEDVLWNEQTAWEQAKSIGLLSEEDPFFKKPTGALTYRFLRIILFRFLQNDRCRYYDAETDLIQIDEQPQMTYLKYLEELRSQSQTELSEAQTLTAEG